jgi:integrase
VKARLRKTKLVFPAELLSRSRSHRDGHPMAIGNFATLVRDSLLAAGVTRPAISAPLEGYARLVGHDLRATFVTLARGAGLPDQFIAQRTGHTTTEMLNRYDHGSWLAKELGLGLPGRLCDLIPELAKMASEPESAEIESAANRQKAKKKGPP